MDFLKKLGVGNVLMLTLCAIIVIVSEYVFLSGDRLHGIFIGLWVPTLLGVLILINLLQNGRR